MRGSATLPLLFRHLGREAGIPSEVAFATKGDLAQRMLARAFAAGVPAKWVVGDTVYGYDEMRSWVEEQGCNSSA